uniref:16S rRNA (uracil(1498)-N(3))-methyltransferase n=1 Tax=Alistipes sp. TaxID=1872444 RepID=UPI0040563610
MQLFFAPDFTPPRYTLSEEESKHAVRVLRLKEGEQLHLTDGCGNLYACRVEEAHHKHCTVYVEELFPQFEKRPYGLTMAVAPTKNIDRFEWFLEKATEVGIDRIIPLESAHSERRAFKHERGEKVITSAMKQSLKAYHPHLEELTPFQEVIHRPFSGRKFIAHCDKALSERGKGFLFSRLRPREEALILIGPEGDFSPEEIRAALDAGFEEITLGAQRLRTETAAVVATVMVATLNTEDNA